MSERTSELTGLSEQQRALALERFRLLQPHIEAGVTLSAIAAEQNLSYRTLKRWLSLYRRFGLGALCRKGRADRGGRRVLSPQVQRLVEGLALQKPPLPIATLYRQVYQYAQLHDEPLPSYAVVYDVVRRLPRDLVALAHEGSKAYGESFEMVHRREAHRPNAIWQADHTMLDILVRRDDGALTKPWLTTVIDDYSRVIAGYFLSFNSPCILHTALALRQAIWRKDDPRWPVCGIPEVLYTDNGSDFTSLHMEQVAADLKIQLIFSRPGQPRGRGRIERFFRSLTSLLIAGLPGYAPSSPPYLASAKGHSKTKGDSSHLTLGELDKRLHDFLVSTYNCRVNSETKATPKDRWESGDLQGSGFLPHMPTSLEQLDLLLLTVAKTRKVHPDGIRFQGLRYIDSVLAAYIGEPVLVRYDPRDVSEIRLFHEGRFLCRALCPELVGETVSLREVVRARSGRRRELRSHLRDRHKTVDALLELKRTPATIIGTARPPDPLDESEEASGRSPALKRYLNE